MASKRDKVPWHVRVGELLRQLGENKISLDAFWRQMRTYDLTDADIDRYCRGER